MLKQTPTSLRRFFGLISVLYFIMAAGAASKVALVFLEYSGGRISALFVAYAVFRIVVAFAFAFVVVKFHSLIEYKPEAVKGIVHANFAGSMIFAMIYLLGGTQLNFLGLLVSLFIYGYLLNSVDRISKEVRAVKAAQSPIAESPASQPRSPNAG